MENYSTVTQIGANTFFLLETVEFSGMVGENIEDHRLYIMNTETMAKTPLTWDEAKQVYNDFSKDATKREKIDAWMTIRAISPKQLSIQAECSRNDALSRVV